MTQSKEQLWIRWSTFLVATPKQRIEGLLQEQRRARVTWEVASPERDEAVIFAAHAAPVPVTPLVLKLRLHRCRVDREQDLPGESHSAIAAPASPKSSRA